ncbi:hypothetical protein RGE_06920 [Rubrivivax gelatinosus IL144]|uniref:Uncharacterized protein n=1 Tax=Rubrivivax gelatinosus (strain NBRC 100245 / IL144) TaxID=983917 RepID=I0HM00_RUBGI|nr:hypothetical protein RGE_06920 [Rubrivivax gelatinosus IL144]
MAYECTVLVSESTPKTCFAPERSLCLFKQRTPFLCRNAPCSHGKDGSYS